MPENNVAATQPALDAQTSVEKQGAANSSVSDFAKALLAKAQAEPVTPAEEKAPESEKAPENTEPATEEAKSDSGEGDSNTETAEDAETQSEDGAEEEKPDEVLSNESKLDPKLQEKIDKRIGKEVAKRRALETKLAELEAKINATPEPKEEPIVVQPTAAQPLAHINTQSELEQYAQAAQETVLWAEMQLDREDFAQNPPMNGDRPLTRAQVREIKANALLAERIQIPARQKFLQAKADTQLKAYEAFPFLKDKSSPEYVEAQQMRKANPWLHGLPNADWIVGVYIKGEKALKSEQESAKKPAAKKAVTSKARPQNDQTIVTTGESSSRSPGAVQKQATQAMSNALNGKRGVSHNDFAAYLLASSKLRNT